jgi:hypothetical protein
MVYLQSVFYCGELEDQTVLEEHAQHSEGSIFHPLPLYAGFSVPFGLGASFLKDKQIRPANLFDQMSHFS